MKKQMAAVMGTALVALAMAGCSTTPEQESQPQYTGPATVECRMMFSLSGWSLIYKSAKGTGTVRCDNGQTMPVSIKVVGGGLTAGKFRVENGHGNFSDVHDISEVLGSYVQGGAHAGAVKSASAQALTKGVVSLALVGTGQGINLGVDVSKFTISRR